MAYIVSAYIVMAYILPRCVDIRASSGISGNPQPAGPLCFMWPMGTSRGAKLHLGRDLGQCRASGAWRSAGTYHGTYHEVQVPRAQHPPCTSRSPDQPQTGSPTRIYCLLVPQGPELLILHVDGAKIPRMEVGGSISCHNRIPCNGELPR